LNVVPPQIRGDAFVRRTENRLQLGLPEVDVDDLWTRIVAIRGDLDAGRLTTF
jgi:hypothetical protein